MTLEKCVQRKCSFNMFAGCKPCKDCKAPPNIVDSDCDTCFCCCHDQGVLRWDDNSPFTIEDIKQEEEVKQKPMIVEMK